MAVRIQLRRDTAANWTSNNPTLREGEVGIETDTLKMKVGNGSSTWTQITNYANVVPSNLNTTLNGYVEVGDIGAESGVAGLNGLQNLLIPNDSIIFEGATEDDYQTTLTVTDPTADRTITFPNATGTVALAENVAALSGATFTGNISVPTAITFEGATANDFETTIQVTDPTADRTITIPDAGGTVALTSNIPSSTDGLSEGSTNKYFTDERAQDAIATAIAAGTHTNITITYDDDNNKFTFVGANTYSNENAQDAVGEAVGTGLSYNDTTGAISVDTTTIQARVADVSDTEIGYLNGVTSAIQTQINDKAPINNPTFTGTVTLAADPASALQAATKQYVDNTASGIVAKPQVLGATTANIDATYNNGTAGVGATLTHNTNGVFPAEAGGATGWAVGKGILVKNQTNKAHNGRYFVSNMGSVSTPYVLTRCSFCDEASEIPGAYIYVQAGTSAGTGWIQVVADPTTFVVGTDNIDVYQFSGSGTITAGTGITVSGNEVSINTAATVDLSTAQTLTNKTLTSPKINEDVAVTATATELNVLDGITSSTAELNILDGVTSTAAELNILDGVTSTAAELNILDGATLSTTELNYVDGVTSAIQTQLDGKVDESLFDTKGDILVASADNTPAKLAAGTNGYLLTANSAATNGVEWAAAPVSLPDQTGNSGEYLTTNGTTASWDAISEVPAVTTSTAAVTNTALISSLSDAIGYIDIYDGPTIVTVQINLSSNPTNGDADAINAAYPVGSTVILAASADPSVEFCELIVTEACINDGPNILWENLTFVSGTVAGVDDGIFRSPGVATTGKYLTNDGTTSYWATVDALPTQTNNSGKYLTTNGSAASWATLVVPIETGTDTVTGNTVETVDTTALSAFTSIEYMVSLKQGSKARTSKVIVQTDGTNVDMTEFAITETGGTISGVVVSAAVSSTNAVLQVTATDAATTNVAVKFSKVKL